MNTAHIITVLLTIFLVVTPDLNLGENVSKFVQKDFSKQKFNSLTSTLRHGNLAESDCPCNNPDWCSPITDIPEKEVFMFSIRNDATHWERFDWSKLTTLVMFNYLNETLMCLAHSYNVRVVILGNVGVETFTVPSKRQEWIQAQLLLVKQNFLDGINFDYECSVGENDTLIRDSYTTLVKETALAFKKEFPYSQISVDVGWKPNVDIRFFDYQGLAAAADLLFVMAYDEQSQIFGECIAGPNSAYMSANAGLDEYLNGLTNSIPANKLILGLPWYGYIYECINVVEDKCYINEVPFRGVNCSDAAGSQYDYGPLYYLIQTIPEKYKWNTTSQTPYVTYSNAETGKSYQIQFDNPKSLKLKYDLAAQKGLRGIGVWNIDSLDFSDTQVGESIRSEMFGALPARKVEASLKYVQEKNVCPCQNPKWCKPVKETLKLESFVFSYVNDDSLWELYDWQKATAIIIYNDVNSSLVCMAHSHNVQAIMNVDIDSVLKLSPVMRKRWIMDQADVIKNNFLDGIIIESSLPISELDTLSHLQENIVNFFKNKVPHLQIRFVYEIKYYDYSDTIIKKVIKDSVDIAFPTGFKRDSEQFNLMNAKKHDNLINLDDEESKMKKAGEIKMSEKSYRPNMKSDCPCENPNWCEPIKDTTRKEVFAFSIVNNETHWKEFDWSKITTLAICGYVSSELMCLAHSFNVKVVTLVDIDVITMITPTLRQQWINLWLNFVRNNFLDGLNFDLEINISPEHKALRDAYTATVNETVTAFRQVMPYSQISIDVQADAFTISRSYDYPTLAQLVDFLFIMAYDESGFDVVGPNAGVTDTVTGILHYFNENIGADKLVLGLPWYGYVYICSKLVGDKCYLSTTRAQQVDYNSISAILETMPDKYQWNATSETPFFSYIDAKTNIPYQIQFDDPTSLKIKYDLAADLNLRGIGMWTIDFLDYSDSDRGKKMREAWFGALPTHS